MVKTHAVLTLCQAPFQHFPCVLFRHLILSTIPYGRHYYCPHFTAVETEVQELYGLLKDVELVRDNVRI